MSEHVAGKWCADLHCAKCYSADTWQKSELVKERTYAEGVRWAALRLVNLAGKAHDLWDADEDSKVGKLLRAMGGGLPKYREEIDRIHAILAKNPVENEISQVQRQGADSPASATTDPSGEQDQARDAVTTAATPLNAPLATPGAQSAPATTFPAIGNVVCPTPAGCAAQQTCKRHDAGQQAKSCDVRDCPPHEWDMGLCMRCGTTKTVPSQCHVPAGWKLVPLEATDGMIGAAHSSFNAIPDPGKFDPARHYRCMVKAAPVCPAQSKVSEEGGP